MIRSYEHRCAVRGRERYRGLPSVAIATRRGWPRPIVGGWPVPWVSFGTLLGRVFPKRAHEVVEFGLCQICGEKPARDSRIYLMINRRAAPIPESLVGKILQAADNAVMHEHCMKLAAGRCPVLRELRSTGDLILYSALYESVLVYDTQTLSGNGIDRFERKILGVDGDAPSLRREFFPEEAHLGQNA